MIPNLLVPSNSNLGRSDLGPTQRPSSILSAAPAGQEPFKEALLEEVFAAHKRTPLDWVVSIAIHAAIVAAVVIVPIFFTQTLDLTHLQTTYLLSPVPPGPPPPPPPAAVAARPQQAPRRPSTLIAKMFAPVAIPKTVEKSAAEEAPPDTTAGILGGVAGGVPGGQVGGVLGGAIGGSLGSDVAAPPPQIAKVTAASVGPLRIGGNVKPPRAISKPAPDYPLIAKSARVEGVVQIEAVIDDHGNVVQAHVMDGPPILFAAALRAVSQWKYEPTYLNGQPYPVDLMIEVTFHLG